VNRCVVDDPINCYDSVGDLMNCCDVLCDPVNRSDFDQGNRCVFVT
jgi:hypothetical protein